MNKTLVVACVVGALTVVTDLYRRLDDGDSNRVSEQAAFSPDGLLTQGSSAISEDTIKFFENYGGRSQVAKAKGKKVNNGKTKPKKPKAPKVVEPWGELGLKLGDKKYRLVAVFMEGDDAFAHLLEFDLKSGKSEIIQASLGKEISTAQVIEIQPSKIIIKTGNGTLQTLQVFNVSGVIG